jgi:hypothetical protein
MIDLVCEVCFKEFSVKPCNAATAHYCSNKCRGRAYETRMRGDNNPSSAYSIRRRSSKLSEYRANHPLPRTFEEAIANEGHFHLILWPPIWESIAGLDQDFPHLRGAL